MTARGAALLLVLAAGAGCQKQPVLKCSVFPVPPEDARSPKYDLPLSADSRKDLLELLNYGLNQRNREEGVGTSTDARPVYEKRLAMLDAKLNADSLQTPAFKQWLTETVLRPVVDARDRTGAKPAPVAAGDGTYWWVFYADANGNFIAVMAAKLNACLNLQEAAH